MQNLFESSSETCMWNMSPFREVDLFHRKMLTVSALEISWNFNIFSKFTNFYQTCKTYLNQHQKDACEIWAHSDKLTYFIEKCRQCRLKYHEISTFFQSSPTFIKLAKHIWIIIRNMHVKFEPIQRSFIFHRKLLTVPVPALEISLNFNIFSKFTKFHQTCRIYLNHHQKHAYEIWAHSEKLTYFIEKCRQCLPYKYHEISTFFHGSPNFIKLAEHIWIIIRNMHVKFEPIQRSFIFHRKMLTVPALEISWNFNIFFKIHQISSNLQNIFESSSETCMWNMSPFREVDLFHRKMLTVPALEISWNFNIFSKFTNFYQTCKTYLNHHQKHACKIWAYSEKFYFSQKIADSASPRNIMKFQHFFKVHQLLSNLQNIFESSSETCMWNLSLFREVLFFTEKCWQYRP